MLTLYFSPIHRFNRTLKHCSRQIFLFVMNLNNFGVADDYRCEWKKMFLRDCLPLVQRADIVVTSFLLIG